MQVNIQSIGMHNHSFSFFRPKDLAFAGSMLISASLTTSRAILSIGMLLVLVAAAMQWLQKGRNQSLRTPWLIAAFASIFGLFLGSVLITEDLNRWALDLQVKLPMIAIPLAYGLLPAFRNWQYALIAATGLFVNSLIAALSLGIHLSTLGSLEAFWQSDAYIPILTDINHIYFSVILAFSVLMGFYLFRKKTHFFFPNERWLLLAFSVLGLVCLHILKSRTGVLSFYAGLGGMLLFTDIRQQIGKWAMGLSLLAGLVAILYLNVPFFQQRLSGSVADALQYSRPESQRRYSSISLRFKAWESAWKIYRQAPFLGTGSADIETQMIRQYRHDGFSARRSLWLDSVHNQYLESLAGSGLVGLSLLLLLLVFPIFFIRIPHPEVLAAFIAVVGCAMLTESFLERQIGIGFFVVGVMLITAQGRERFPFARHVIRWPVWSGKWKEKISAIGRAA